MNKKIKKALKVDSIFVFFLIFLMFALSIGSIVYIIKYTQLNPEEFELKIIEEGIEEDISKGSYGLFISGELYSKVNYNEYARKSISDGKTNEKMCLLIDCVHRAAYYILLGIVFMFIYLIMKNIIKEGRPFSKTNILFLRIVAILVMLTSIIPGVIKSLMTFFIFLNPEISSEYINFLGLILGVLIGILSNIFKHGSEIQEDIDNIA
jgi:hypothetical protein